MSLVTFELPNDSPFRVVPESYLVQFSSAHKAARLSVMGYIRVSFVVSNSSQTPKIWPDFERA